MSRPIHAAAFVLVLGAFASSAEAQAVLDDPRLGASRAPIAAAVEAARAAGLPEEWILDKVAEGLSKRVPAPRIASAVEQLLARMRSAHQVVVPVDGGNRRALLRAGLDALAAGAPVASIRILVRDIGVASPDRVLRALVTVAELAERGFGGAASVEATGNAYRRGRLGGLQELLSGARRLRSPDRDAGLRQLGREVRRRGVDRDRPSRDHRSGGPRR